MKNSPRLRTLFTTLAMLFIAPSVNAEKIKSTQREIHYAGGGGNPYWVERRKKFKGWQRENRKYNSKHFN